MSHCHDLFLGFFCKHITMPIILGMLFSRIFSTNVYFCSNWLSLYMKIYTDMSYAWFATLSDTHLVQQNGQFRSRVGYTLWCSLEEPASHVLLWWWMQLATDLVGQLLWRDELCYVTAPPEHALWYQCSAKITLMSEVHCSRPQSVPQRFGIPAIIEAINIISNTCFINTFIKSNLSF
jgi:hypothetical protein